MWEEGHWTGADYDALGKKRSIQLWKFDRPHMRAFHFAWFAFHICFLLWFAIPPLMTTIRKPRCLEPTSPECVACGAMFQSALAMGLDSKCRKCQPRDTRANAGCGGLGLTPHQVVVSNAVSALGTIIVRVFLGSTADAIGVRWSYIIILVVSSIPGFCIAAVDSPDAFIAVRFLISAVGGSFVITQVWTSTMFAPNIVGTANAISAGWGNLGGGVASAVIPQVFNSLISHGYDNNMAWRYALIWPPAVLIGVAVAIFFLSDDTPYGCFHKLCKRAERARLADPNYVPDPKAETAAKAQKRNIAIHSLKAAALNWRTWILFWGYAFSFGVDVAAYNNLPTYFTQAYSLSQADAGLVNSLYSIFHFFARPLGGITSDLLHSWIGVRGRIWNNFLTSLLMGVCLLVFSCMTKDNNGLAGALVTLCFWALFLTMTEGAIYGLVPFIEPTAVGGVSGIVGAGGSVGALIVNFIIGMGARPAFNVVGWLSIWSAMLLPLLYLHDVGSMLRINHVKHDPIIEHHEQNTETIQRILGDRKQLETQPAEPSQDEKTSHPWYCPDAPSPQKMPYYDAPCEQRNAFPCYCLNSPSPQKMSYYDAPFARSSSYPHLSLPNLSGQMPPTCFSFRPQAVSGLQSFDTMQPSVQLIPVIPQPLSLQHSFPDVNRKSSVDFPQGCL